MDVIKYSSNHPNRLRRFREIVFREVFREIVEYSYKKNIGTCLIYVEPSPFSSRLKILNLSSYSEHTTTCDQGTNLQCRQSVY